MKLIAIKGMTYGGKWRNAGDTFDASESDARVLIAVKAAEKPKAKPDAPVKTKDMTAADDSDRGKAGTYNRKDMHAK